MTAKTFPLEWTGADIPQNDDAVNKLNVLQLMTLVSRRGLFAQEEANRARHVQNLLGMARHNQRQEFFELDRPQIHLHGHASLDIEEARETILAAIREEEQRRKK